MKTETTKRIIGTWLNEFRPDLEFLDELDEQKIDYIYKEIKEEIEGLDNEAASIIIREFLHLNYSSEVFSIIEKLVEEPPFKETFDGYKEIGFLYTTEVGAIMSQIAEEKIVEKFGGDDKDSYTTNEILIDKIRDKLHRYLKRLEERSQEEIN